MAEAGEDLVRLSESDLWQGQREFYQQEGIGAWQGKIPFYATSNPYIANSYANIILAYMQDVAARSGTPEEPFHVVELGAGSGNFGFYLLRRLDALLESTGDAGLRFVYVMTDFAESNIEFWRTHPALHGYIQDGKVDFARFDLGRDTELELRVSGETLTAGDGERRPGPPLIVLANYVLDTVPMDLFAIKEGALEQGKVKRSPSFEAGFPANVSVPFAAIDSPVQYEAVSLPFYDDADLDAVLARYIEAGIDSFFSIPIAGMKGIEALDRISDSGMLLLASDKGYARHHELFETFEPELAFHDAACSMMVNLHAIGEYFGQKEGDVFHQRTQQGLATSVFVSGDEFARLPRTARSADTYLNTFSPGDLFNVYTHLADTKLNCSLETLISYLNMTHWDPQVFNLHLDLILTLVKVTNLSVIKDLADGLPRVADNYYHMPGAVDTMANLGLVLQEIGLYREALDYYDASRKYFGDSEIVSYNLGLCHFFLEEYERSIEMFEAAIERSPDYILAKGWLVQARELALGAHDGTPEAEPSQTPASR